jgi:hypothetical protein
MTGFSGGLLRGCLPKARGGMGDDLRAPFTAEEWERGKPFTCTGEIIRIDSMPTAYDWESWPQLLHSTGVLQRIDANYARYAKHSISVSLIQYEHNLWADSCTSVTGWLQPALSAMMDRTH